MKRLRHSLGRLLPLAFALLLVACAGAASVDTANDSSKPPTVTLADLQGSYAGTFDSRGIPDGVTYFSDELTLEIENDTATWGSLQSGSGSSRVRLADNGQTVSFVLGSGERTFSVGEADGVIVLQAHYRANFGRWPRSNLITLTRKTSQ